MTPNAAIQALMQAAVDPVDQWTLDNWRWMSQESFFKQWREAKIQKEKAVANHG